jgi:bacteriocin biosynthesis cyclodehydratase domain-containing protein
MRYDPPRDDGEGELVITSEGSRFVMRGHLFPVFLEQVVPRLSGRLTLDEIVEQVSAHLDPADLERTILLLAEQGIVVDGERRTLLGDDADRIAPQLAYLHEVSTEPEAVMQRLADARVTVVGLGAVGAVAATALAAANVGHLRCVDASRVSAADPYLAQLFELSDVGSLRSSVAADKIRAINHSTSVEVRSVELVSDADVAAAVASSDFVLGCVEPGLSALTGAINRACLAQRTPWASATVTAFEGVVGPTVIPYETACFRCYQARAIACAEDPVEALGELRAQEAERTDRSAVRENLAFGAGIVGNLLALQAFQALTGLRPRTAGRILTIDLLSTAMTERVVLRKPWCEACFAQADP